MKSDFTAMQAAVYVLLCANENADVSIRDMFKTAYGIEAAGAPHDVRYMQQRLSPIIQRINLKLPDGHRIVPGELKRTYRLNTNYAG